MNSIKVFGIDRHRMKTDGRGVTTLVALPGCPLNCRYCINQKELADIKLVEEISVQELLEQVAIDHCYFIYTGGGVTFGGGEPLLQSEQIAEFAELCPKEWNITIETSLNVSEELLQPVLSERFSFIIDIKAIQPEIYNAYTGKTNEGVITNLKKLIAGIPEANYVIKVPQIPGYAKEAEVKDSIKMLKDMGIPESNIVTFDYVIKEKG